jgi:hypothetical protein
MKLLLSILCCLLTSCSSTYQSATVSGSDNVVVQRIPYADQVIIGNGRVVVR